MGELHLEVIGERIKTEYKIDVDLSRPQISYKEGIISESKQSHKLDLKIGTLLLIYLVFIYYKIRKIHFLICIKVKLFN